MIPVCGHAGCPFPTRDLAAGVIFCLAHWNGVGHGVGSCRPLRLVVAAVLWGALAVVMG